MFKETLEKANLIERIYWLICLRWFVTGGLFITTYVVSSVFDVVTWVAPLYIIGIILGISNAGFCTIEKSFKQKIMRLSRNMPVYKSCWTYSYLLV